MLAAVLFAILTTFLVPITCQDQKEIVRLTRYDDTPAAVVECDIDKFAEDQVTDKPYLMILGMERKLRSDELYRLMAAYQPYFAPEHRKIFYTPPEENWNVKFIGGDGWTNKNTIKLVVTMFYLNCKHSGLYRCYYHPPGTMFVTYSDPYNFTACGTATKTWTPVNGQWSDWSDWSCDTVTSMNTRRRYCNNPPPSNDGKNCEGSETEKGDCESTTTPRQPSGIDSLIPHCPLLYTIFITHLVLL